MNAVLLLEDGTLYRGKGFGKIGTAIGEVVFNTCMTGYQEVMTDPSYHGQIVTMTYPLIGNYGFTKEDVESRCPWVRGFVVKEFCEVPSNWRCESTAVEYFTEHHIVGISGIDTRGLTQHIRSFGSMLGIISNEDENIDALKAQLIAYQETTQELVREVSTPTPYHIPGAGKRVVVLDFGVKYNILRSLQKRDCDIHVLPYNSTYEEIMSKNPDGILFSNGPGDPKDISSIVLPPMQALFGKKPIMGICLGHQLLGLALGGDTYKLKFGHHGGNHAVRDYLASRCYITSQNHNYALRPDFSREVKITHLNVNDGTVEGFRHHHFPILSVQFHPEASPGPLDTAYLFDQFVTMMK